METTNFSHSLTIHASNPHVQRVLNRFEERCRHVPCLARSLYDLIAACQQGLTGAQLPRRGIALPMTRLTTALGVGESTVSRMIKSLVDAGLLKVRRASEGERRAGGVNSYWLVDGGNHAVLGAEQSTAVVAMNAANTVPTTENAVSVSENVFPSRNPVQSASKNEVETDVTLKTGEAMALTALLFDDAVSAAVQSAIADGSFDHVKRLGLSEGDAALVWKQVRISRAETMRARSTEAQAHQRVVAEAQRLSPNRGPLAIADVLSASAPAPSAAITPKLEASVHATVKENRWKDIWTEIRDAVGGTGRARAVLAELKWSATLGQLKKWGDHGLAVGMKLIKQGRWTVPFHMPATAYSDIPDGEWMHG